MIAFGWVTNLLQRGMASWKRMLEVLDAVPAVSDAQVAPMPRRSRRPRQIRGDDRVPRISRSASAASRCCTTCSTRDSRRHDHGDRRRHRARASPRCSSLLARLHEPPPGTVFVDGHDVRHLPLSVLRGAIGFVPQEPFLFSATIAENITLGEPDGRAGRAGWPRERVEAAAATARLDADLAVVSAGLRHGRRGARHHAVGRAEAAHGAGARARRPTRASWCSTTRCRPWTRTPRRRSCSGCAA